MSRVTTSGALLGPQRRPTKWCQSANQITMYANMDEGMVKVAATFVLEGEGQTIEGWATAPGVLRQMCTGSDDTDTACGDLTKQVT